MFGPRPTFRSGSAKSQMHPFMPSLSLWKCDWYPQPGHQRAPGALSGLEGVWPTCRSGSAKMSNSPPILDTCTHILLYSLPTKCRIETTRSFSGLWPPKFLCNPKTVKYRIRGTFYYPKSSKKCASYEQ